MYSNPQILSSMVGGTTPMGSSAGSPMSSMVFSSQVMPGGSSMPVASRSSNETVYAETTQAEDTSQVTVKTGSQCMEVGRGRVTREALQPILYRNSATGPVREEQLPTQIKTRAFEVFRRDPQALFPGAKIVSVGRMDKIITPSGSVYDPATNTITSAYSGEVAPVQAWDGGFRSAAMLSKSLPSNQTTTTTTAGYTPASAGYTPASAGYTPAAATSGSYTGYSAALSGAAVHTGGGATPTQYYQAFPPDYARQPSGQRQFYNQPAAENYYSASGAGSYQTSYQNPYQTSYQNSYQTTPYQTSYQASYPMTSYQGNTTTTTTQYPATNYQQGQTYTYQSLPINHQQYTTGGGGGGNGAGFVSQSTTPIAAAVGYNPQFQTTAYQPTTSMPVRARSIPPASADYFPQPTYPTKHYSTHSSDLYTPPTAATQRRI